MNILNQIFKCITDIHLKFLSFKSKYMNRSFPTYFVEGWASPLPSRTNFLLLLLLLPNEYNPYINNSKWSFVAVTCYKATRAGIMSRSALAKQQMRPNVYWNTGLVKFISKCIYHRIMYNTNNKTYEKYRYFHIYV